MEKVGILKNRSNFDLVSIGIGLCKHIFTLEVIVTLVTVKTSVSTMALINCHLQRILDLSLDAME